MKQINIVWTKHYKRFHEKEVAWEQVLRTIFTAKRKMKGNDIIEYKSDKFYVLCRKAGDELKVINAKKRK